MIISKLFMPLKGEIRPQKALPVINIIILKVICVSQTVRRADVIPPGPSILLSGENYNLAMCFNNSSLNDCDRFFFVSPLPIPKNSPTSSPPVSSPSATHRQPPERRLRKGPRDPGAGKNMHKTDL